MRLTFTRSEADDRPIEEQWHDYIRARWATLSGDMGEMAEDSLERECDGFLEGLHPNVRKRWELREMLVMIKMLERPKPQPTRTTEIAGMTVKVYE